MYAVAVFRHSRRGHQIFVMDGCEPPCVCWNLNSGPLENITSAELIELEDITRKSLKKFLTVCKLLVQQKQNITWQEIKAGEISDLRNRVGLAIKAGTLPPGNDTVFERFKAWCKKLFKKR